jgi:hypothetical protein
MLSFAALAVAAAIGAGAVAGLVLFGPDVFGLDDDGGSVEVVIREGDPVLDEDTGDALVVLGAALIERLVVDSLNEANLDFELEDITAEFVEDGIEVSGEVEIEVQGVPLSPEFSAVVHPLASDGGVAVEVGEVRAAGARLPSFFESGIERVINRQLEDAVRIDDYTIEEVEVGKEELLLFLRYTGE